MQGFLDIFLHTKPTQVGKILRFFLNCLSFLKICLSVKEMAFSWQILEFFKQICLRFREKLLEFFFQIRLEFFFNMSKKACLYCDLTLKQTQSENGSVTITRAHEMVVSNQPHRPTPLSDSSAEREKKTYELTFGW